MTTSRPSPSRPMRPRRAVPGLDPTVGRLSEMLLALLSQVTVMRERLDTVERLIERHGLFARSAIEEFAPDAAEETARTALRRRQIQTVMRPLEDEARRAALAVDATAADDAAVDGTSAATGGKEPP